MKKIKFQRLFLVAQSTQLVGVVGENVVGCFETQKLTKLNSLTRFEHPAQFRSQKISALRAKPHPPWLRLAVLS